MDEATVRAHAQDICDALIAGEIDRATQDFSQELRSNLGEVIAQLPLPVTEATVESVDAGGKGLVVVLRLVGESDTVRLQTRWKDRDGQPTVVEVSHVTEEAARVEPEPEPSESE
jgi:hypothetical protein